MKKIKLLSPLLSTGLLLPTATLIASCGNNSAQTTNVSLDTSSCKAEQTTDQNITMNTYVFNIKNFDESKNELIAEIEKSESADSVTIEITSTEYKAAEHKFYVYVTTSKEDGTLNDNESVKFSIKFKCVNKQTQEVIWEKSIDSLVIKHVESETTTQHFIDTDVNKLFTTKTTGQQTISLTFPLGDIGKWTNKDTADMYNIANLSVAVYQSDLAKLSKITISDVTSEWIKTTIDGVDVYTDLKVNIKIDVPEDIKDTLTSYNLYFEYSSPEMLVKDTWRQTIGGFRISYNKKYTGDHIKLASSRERYFYKEISSQTETATNYVVVQLLDDRAASYEAKDFTITSNNENVIIGSDLITYKLKDEISPGTYYYYLAIPYTIKQEQHSWFEPKDKYNVTFTIASKATYNEWTEDIKGLSFFNRMDYKTKSLVWYENKFGQDPIKSLKAGEKKTIDNKFKTISPFDLKYIILSEVTCSDIENIDFKINTFNWEQTSIDITLPSTATAGKHTISYTIMVGTEHCAYKYTLSVETDVTAA